MDEKFLRTSVGVQDSLVGNDHCMDIDVVGFSFKPGEQQFVHLFPVLKEGFQSQFIDWMFCNELGLKILLQNIQTLRCIEFLDLLS